MEMSEMAGAPLERLIRQEGFACSCGRRHTAPISCLHIGPGVIRRLPEVLKTLKTEKPYVLCGPHGYQAAGETVCGLLREQGIPFALHVLPEEGGGRIKPAEAAAGSALLHFDHDCDLVLGVGSGVINDLSKVLARTAGRPCVIVATAPSMDGYASDSASLEVDGIKASIKEQMPTGILCDTEIMAGAPMRMLLAGLGDILAKYTALMDWRIAELVTGEYRCEEIEKLVRASVQKTVEAAPGLINREELSVRAVTEGLVLSGIGIAFTGNSHPASGLDHYFSHCWEMMQLERGREYDLHGIQVGVGMLLTLKIAERFRRVRPTMARAEAAADRFDAAAWETELRRVFPHSAEDLLELERRVQKNERSGRLRRAARAIEHWDEIRAELEALPDSGEMQRWMRSLGMPTTPQEIGLSTRDTVDAFLCSRDIRDKYLLSSLIWDLGYMEEIAQGLRDDVRKSKML